MPDFNFFLWLDFGYHRFRLLLFIFLFIFLLFLLLFLLFLFSVFRLLLLILFLLVKGFKPILNEVFWPVKLVFSYYDLPQIAGFKVHKINILLDAEYKLADSIMADLMIFVLIFWSSFEKCFSEKYHCSMNLYKFKSILHIEFIYS